MDKILYLLRRHPDRISSSLFRATDGEMDVVLIEEAASSLSSIKGKVFLLKESSIGDSRSTWTYDELVEKIFSTEHVIVI